MKSFILSLIVLSSAQMAFASGIDECMDRASKHTAFTKDSAYKDCAQFASNVDECITISTKLTRLTQDHFLNNQCIQKSSTYAECAKVANRISMPNVKDGALSTCGNNFPQAKQ